MDDPIAGARGWPGADLSWKLVGWLAFLAAVFCVFQLVLLAVSGGEPFPLLRVYRPRMLLAAAVAAGIVAWAALFGVRRDAAALREAAARFALAAASTVIAFTIAEAALRVGLWRVTSTSRLEDLGDAGRNLPQARIKSSHPLAVIIRRSADERLIYEITPGLDRLFGPVRLRTNSVGMRSDQEFSTEKARGTVRVVGIGDSGMFGWAVEQNEDPVTVLGQLLNARGDGSRYEAINLAVPGYNTQMEVDSLVGKGLRYRPDIVVVGWCENDYQLPFLIPQGGQWTRRDVSFLWLLAFQRPRFSQLAFVLVRDVDKADADLVPSYFRENSGPEGVRRTLARLRDLAAREGFHAIVFGPLEPQSEAVCRAVGIPYYNTLEKIPAGTWPAEWAVHFMHPRAGGYRLIAEHLVAEFERRGWIRPGTAAVGG